MREREAKLQAGAADDAETRVEAFIDGLLAGLYGRDRSDARTAWLPTWKRVRGARR